MSLEGFRSYAQDQFSAVMVECKVVKYEKPLMKTVNDICFQISFYKGAGDMQTFNRLAMVLREELNVMTTDIAEKDNLIQYTRKIIDIGVKYLVANQKH